MGIQVPERRAVDTGGVIRSRQVDNMNYLLRVDGGVMGTMQVSYTAWYGTGDRFEVYGTQGMLLLGSKQSTRSLADGSRAGNRPTGAMRLYGARVDIDRLLSSPTPPEHLQHGFEELDVPERFHAPLPEKADPFAVGPAWVAFADAIREGRECSPSFRDKLRIHRIWDAAERSVASKAGWMDVDYAGID